MTKFGNTTDTHTHTVIDMGNNIAAHFHFLIGKEKEEKEL